MKLKKPLFIVGIVAGALLVLTVVLGIFNALVADGGWYFGWESYRYDEEGYEKGGSSVPSLQVTAIDIDWLDGSVTVLPCDDKYISLSERAVGGLEEGQTLRWRLSEDGSTLSVKYRKSSWFLGASVNRNKELVLRVPRGLLEGLTELKIKTARGTVTVQGIEAANTEILTERGDVRLSYDRDASFALQWAGEKGKLVSDLPLTEENGLYRYGDGKGKLCVTSKWGDLMITALD